MVETHGWLLAVARQDTLYAAHGWFKLESRDLH